jgi:hypothetical protein
MRSGVALQQRERRLLQCRPRALSRLFGRRAVFERGGVQVFQIRDQLVDGRVGQLEAGLGDVLKYLFAEIHDRHASLTPAMSVSATMNRPQSSRCDASIVRPLSVIR